MPGIISISVLFHFLYLWQLKQTPYISYPLVDAAIYHEKALNIINDGWLGDRVFFQAPLYPYLLASIYYLFGPSIEFVIWIQALFSILNIYLIYLLGKHLFSIEVGILSSILGLFYGVMIFYSGLLLKVTFSIFFTCLFLLLILKATKEESHGVYFISGITLGFCTILRGNFLLVFIGIIIWLTVFAKNLRNKIYSATALIIGFTLIILPITLRNYYLQNDFVLINYDAGPSFFIGNNPKANGYYEPFDFFRPNPKYERKDFTTRAEKIIGRSLKPSEVSSFWFKMSFHYIQEKPLHWLYLQWKKFLLFINTYEKPDNYNFKFMQKVTPILKIGFIPFGAIIILALASIIIGRWNHPRFWLFYMFIIFYSASIVIFYINSRYRLPLLPTLFPFAAWTLLNGKTNFCKLSKIMKFFTISIIIFGSWGTFRPTHSIGYSQAHLGYGSILQASGKLIKATNQYEKALKSNPENHQIFFNIASVLAIQGLYEKAIDYYKKALRLKPNSAQAHNNLGVLLIKNKNWTAAEKQIHRAIKSQPDYSDAHYNLGIIFLNKGNLEKAKKQFHKAKKLKQKDKNP